MYHWSQEHSLHFSSETTPRGNKTWLQSQTQNKAQWLADCGHVSASSQSLRFILSLRMNSSFITSRAVLEYASSACSMEPYKFRRHCQAWWSTETDSSLHPWQLSREKSWLCNPNGLRSWMGDIRKQEEERQTDNTVQKSTWIGGHGQWWRYTTKRQTH